MQQHPFTLHPVLQADCHALGRLGATHVLLHRNASMHWFILVPETAHLDLLDLPTGELNDLMHTATALSHLLKQELSYPRVNVGALGLLVPQLHLHVIGRREGDPCWPQPVWGNLNAGASYSESELHRLRSSVLAISG